MRALFSITSGVGGTMFRQKNGLKVAISGVANRPIRPTPIFTPIRQIVRGLISSGPYLGFGFAFFHRKCRQRRAFR